MTDQQQDRPSAEVSQMIEWLREAGYRASATANGRGVSSATNGLTFVVFTYEKSVQFFMGMEISNDRVSPETCNKFNREWRYVKAYLDDEAGLAVEMDVLIDFALGDAKAVFSQAIGLWDSGLGSIKQWLLELAKESESSAQ